MHREIARVLVFNYQSGANSTGRSLLSRDVFALCTIRQVNRRAAVL
jgi:hypothetical protein